MIYTIEESVLQQLINSPDPTRIAGAKLLLEAGDLYRQANTEPIYLYHTLYDKILVTCKETINKEFH